jgi:hypothetical protein
MRQELARKFSENFEIQSIYRAFAEVENSESQIIDFKKEKINWRNKTRMRSNSNELTENV